MSTLVEMFRHNLWANQLILAACRELDETQLAAGAEGTYGAIGDTLVHLFSAEQRYVFALTGRKPATQNSERNGWPGFDDLEAAAAWSGQALIEIAGNDPYGELLSGTWGDQPYTLRAFIPLLQAINHATEHRAHIMTALTQLGLTPPDLSAWRYDSETSGSA